jgi:hypothetical protein
MSDRQITIQWDDTEARTYSADVAQVKASRDGFMLLFGQRRAAVKNQNGHRVPLDTLINMNPVAAKRLAIQLDTVVRQHEAKFGLQDLQAAQQPGLLPTPPIPAPVFRSARGTDKVKLLFGFLKDHQVTPAFERSWGFQAQALNADRFLLGFEKKQVGANPDEKLVDVCLRMDMPEDFLEVFLKNLPSAKIVGFGFGEDENTCIIKAYLELGAPFYRAGSTFDKSEPYLSHLGLKWNADDRSRKALARYTCSPGLDATGVQRRLVDDFYGDAAANPFEIIHGILEHAAAKGGGQRFDFLDVAEENNPRSSYDINVYGAHLQLNEIHSFLLAISRYYQISEEQFSSSYEKAQKHTLGHIAGGRHRNGKDFLTLYFGE